MPRTTGTVRENWLQVQKWPWVDHGASQCWTGEKEAHFSSLGQDGDTTRQQNKECSSNFFLVPFPPLFQSSLGSYWPRKKVREGAAAAAAKLLQSCLTLRPHRRQPTRLPRPWDAPDKDTGVGIQCMKVKRESEVAQSCPTLSNPMDCSPPGSSVHGIFQARVPEWIAIVFSNEKLKLFQLKLSTSPMVRNVY